ncbi:MAG: thermonuclease family protein [Hydrogenophaga sp.]|uniref:thermonuclease family protein n=1 Tax=Hydrogenophaga sp. TaxID=1904254 RepID=UPI0025C52415|nr:thermonuclease family protein [Hydrogenophaga sp.]MBT9550911.1 thermonuclease family protein [Hydrogenophaga sp.]
MLFPSFVFSAALLAIAGSATSAQDAAQPGFQFRADGTYEARVTRVTDGDTLWVKPLTGGKYRKLRIDGLDAPEICQDGGPASKAALSARVLEKVVVVRERRRDDYGRPLVKLQLGGEDVAGWLVSEGQAWSYHWRHSNGPYAEQEDQARKSRKGLFAQERPEVPRDFRRRNGPCPWP